MSVLTYVSYITKFGQILTYMNKKITLSFTLLILFFSGFAQENENYAFDVAQRITFSVPESTPGQLYNTEKRFIQLGLNGKAEDIDFIVQSFDRYTYSDKDMITHVEKGLNEAGIQFYRFYLIDLADANDFEKMLEMYQIKSFISKNRVLPIKDFSMTIYASQKTSK